MSNHNRINLKLELAEAPKMTSLTLLRPSYPQFINPSHPLDPDEITLRDLNFDDFHDYDQL